MRRLYFFLVLLLYNCNGVKYDSKGVIAFIHIGMENHFYNPLYISTEKINIHLSKWQISNLQSIVGKNVKITEQKKIDYIKANFDMIVTNSGTFLTLSEFIMSSKDFYINQENKNNRPDFESYNIHLNDKTFSLYYKKKDQYLYKLKEFLHKRNCDAKVIEAISFL